MNGEAANSAKCKQRRGTRNAIPECQSMSLRHFVWRQNIARSEKPSERKLQFSGQQRRGETFEPRVRRSRQRGAAHFRGQPKPSRPSVSFAIASQFVEHRGGIHAPQGGATGCFVSAFAATKARLVAISPLRSLGGEAFRLCQVAPAFAGRCLVWGSNPQQPDS